MANGGQGSDSVIDDSHETRASLNSAWQAVIKRLLEAGYPPAAVYGTMAVVALGDDAPQQRQAHVTAVEVSSAAEPRMGRQGRS